MALRPAPRNSRELFELFGFYAEKLGLDSMLDQIDLAGVQPRQVYYSVLGRAPESASQVMAARDYSPRLQFRDAIGSTEFQAHIIWRLLEAFEEKRRLVFIHIPKCAGSNLGVRLASRYPHVHATLAHEAWTSKPSLYRSLQMFSLRAAQSDSVFVYGHTPIREYPWRRLLRFDDKVFTVLRNPADIAMSGINYILTRFEMDPDLQAPDTQEWSRLLGISAIPAKSDKEFAVLLARRIIHGSGLITPNPICRFLGESDFASARDNIVIHDIEITDVTRCDAWLKQCWDLGRTSGFNASKPHLSRADLNADDRDALAGHYPEDERLFNLVEDRLRELGSLSVRGAQIA